MAYLFQTFVFKAVFTSAQANQIEINIRDHVHGTAGVGTVPDTGLSANVSLKNIDNLFSAKQSIIFPGASFAVNATTGSPIIDLQRASVLSVRFKSGSSDHLEIQNSGALTRVQWDLSTNPGTLTLGSIPDARLTTNVPLLNAANVFTVSQTIRATGNPGFFLDATTGAPFIRLKLATLNAVSFTAPAVNTFNILDNLDGVRVSWDLSTNPGTLVTGNIPDARLTANVALLNAGNVFTVDQTVRKASAISIIDATTGNPLLRMQRAAANSVAIDSTATNILNFKNNADAARVSWDLSGTVGKLTQGDVPWARVEKTVSLASNTASTFLDVTLPTLVLGDILLITTTSQVTKTSTAGVVILQLLKFSGGGTIVYAGGGTFFRTDHYLPASTLGAFDFTTIAEADTAGTFVLRFTVTGATTASIILRIEVRIMRP